jgi:hypothetical protein
MMAWATLIGEPGSSPSSRLFAIAGATYVTAITNEEVIVALTRRSLMEIAYDNHGCATR